MGELLERKKKRGGIKRRTGGTERKRRGKSYL